MFIQPAKIKIIVTILLTMVLLGAADQPSKAQASSKVSAVYTDGSTSLVIKEDSTLWGWGSNSTLFHRDAKRKAQRSPELIMTNIKGLATDEFGAFFVKNNGDLLELCDDNYASIDPSSEAKRVLAAQLTLLTSHVSAVSVGVSHALALKDDNTLWAWGKTDMDGLLGINYASYDDFSKPNLVMKDVVNFFAGEFHSVAVTKDGQLWTWGQKLPGGSKNTPTKVISGVKMAVASVSSVCSTWAVTKDGRLLEWSWPVDEVLTQYKSPKREITHGIKDLKPGVVSGYAFRTEDDSLWLVSAQDSQENPFKNCINPKKKHGPGFFVMPDVVDYSLGYELLLMVKKDGTLWACGEKVWDELDQEFVDGSSDNVPVQILLPPTPENPKGFFDPQVNTPPASAGGVFT